MIRHLFSRRERRRAADLRRLRQTLSPHRLRDIGLEPLPEPSLSKPPSLW